MSERSKQDRNETPVGIAHQHGDGDLGRPRASLVDTHGLYRHHNVPDNEYEALMCCAPLQEPQSHETSDGKLDELMDRVLTPKEKAVIELLFVGGMSGADAGLFLARQFSDRNKPYTNTYVYKLRDRALAKLRAALEEQ